jgi:DNA modification methylase
MPKILEVKQNAYYTFKYNKSLGRHGWLRLTPAYSVKLVADILKSYANKNIKIFDPFSGTGTTGIVSAMNGYDAILNDINPFLVWFAFQKSKNYSNLERNNTIKKIYSILNDAKKNRSKNCWFPNIHNINRWWSRETLNILSALRSSIVKFIDEPSINNEYNLIWIGFCRLIIETSSASFNHVSMSFKNITIDYEINNLFDLFTEIMESIIESSKEEIIGRINIFNDDSKILKKIKNIDIVITSPPYPNRISYIRELRPYMYWLKFLTSPNDSSEIDWNCIGGTWGSATSKLISWNPEEDINFSLLTDYVNKILSTNMENSKLMSIYVHKYFYDMYLHIRRLYSILNNNSDVYYIIGNSTFFGINVDSDLLYKKMFEMCGFNNIKSIIIRKRNCNKKLFEYCIMASKGNGIIKSIIQLNNQTCFDFD